MIFGAFQRRAPPLITNEDKKSQNDRRTTRGVGRESRNEKRRLQTRSPNAAAATSAVALAGHHRLGWAPCVAHSPRETAMPPAVTSTLSAPAAIAAHSRAAPIHSNAAAI